VQIPCGDTEDPSTEDHMGVKLAKISTKEKETSKEKGSEPRSPPSNWKAKKAKTCA
jgi:hypothetical protein